MAIRKGIFIIVLFSLIGCSERSSNEKEIRVQTEEKTVKDTVYICTGSMSYAYHLKKDCTGLNHCYSGIILMDKKDAIQEEERKLCGYEK